tara:strand:+ start:76 stop:591 length:516 start_codon:yes stop_codon:yes gene_type:complete
MGLKQDLINAKVEATKASGELFIEDQLDTSVGSQIEVEAELTKEAIVDFLTKCEFRITQLNANVVLEDFKLPPQQGDVLPSVSVSSGFATFVPMSPALGGIPVQSMIAGGKNGVLTKNIDAGKDVGGLDSTGYVYIGGDPDSQGAFDVDDEDGQREFTTVKLIREDIEDLL